MSSNTICLVNGKHTPGSDWEKECPELRRESKKRAKLASAAKPAPVASQKAHVAPGSPRRGPNVQLGRSLRSRASGPRRHGEAPESEDKTPWRVVRAAVICRDGHKCRKCKASLALTVHHIKPRESGGSDSPRNLLTLCASCHDWAEIETAERGLAWAELVHPPTSLLDEAEAA